jgi:hypothetical protein
MFDPVGQITDVLRQAWLGWSMTNWVRSGLCLLALVCELSVLSLFESRSAITKTEINQQ